MKKEKLLPPAVAAAAVVERLMRLEAAAMHAVAQELCIVLIEHLHARGQADALVIAQTLLDRMTNPEVLALLPQAGPLARDAAARLRQAVAPAPST